MNKLVILQMKLSLLDNVQVLFHCQHRKDAEWWRWNAKRKWLVQIHTSKWSSMMFLSLRTVCRIAKSELPRRWISSTMKKAESWVVWLAIVVIVCSNSEEASLTEQCWQGGGERRACGNTRSQWYPFIWARIVGWFKNSSSMSVTEISWIESSTFKPYR